MPECCETGRLEGDHIGGGFGGVAKPGSYTIHSSLFLFLY